MALNPGRLIITASHSADLAERFGRKARNVVASDDYRNVFGVSLATDSRSANRWEASNGSEFYGVGVNGSVTGRRGDLGFIDDPVKGRKEAESEAIQNAIWDWYISDFRTRLKPNAGICLIMTRWVENDLAGKILPEDYDGRSGPVHARDGEVWEVVNLPMEAIEGDVLGRKPGELLWPEWFNADWVKTEKRIQGPRNWQSLYQQNPTPDEGSYYKRADFRWYETKPKHLKVYMSGDYAVTEDGGDFTQLGVWGVDPQDDVYLLDRFKGQVDIIEVVDRLLDFAEKYDIQLSIGETGVIRRAMEPILKRRMRERGILIRLEWLTHSHGDKPAMGRSFQALVQQNRVYLPKNEDGEDLLNELIKFPAGAYDDGADMCALFGRHINKVWAAKAPEPKPEPRTLIEPGVVTISDIIGEDEEWMMQ